MQGVVDLTSDEGMNDPRLSNGKIDKIADTLAQSIAQKLNYQSGFANQPVHQRDARHHLHLTHAHQPVHQPVQSPVWPPRPQTQGSERQFLTEGEFSRLYPRSYNYYKEALLGAKKQMVKYQVAISQLEKEKKFLQDQLLVLVKEIHANTCAKEPKAEKRQFEGEKEEEGKDVKKAKV